MEGRGFCVLEPWDSSYTTLKTVASLFGDTQSHIRANPDGVVGEGESRISGWKAYAEEYQGITDDEFPPHTDGSYLHGATLVDGVLARVGPPKFVILQCVRCAEDGGGNILVDSQRVFERLVLDRPDLAGVLLSPGCITFCRDDQLALDLPIYRSAPGSRFRVRYRFDAAAYAPPWSLPALRTLHREYHLNPEYTLKVSLRPGQILVVDNFRVLHGREAFNSAGAASRKFRRVWINDDAPAALTNALIKPSAHRALAAYAPYRSVANDCPEGLQRIGVVTGIRPSPQAMRAVKLVMQTISRAALGRRGASGAWLPSAVL